MNSLTRYVKCEFKPGLCSLCKIPIEYQYWNDQLVQNACCACAAMIETVAASPYFVTQEYEYQKEMEHRKRLLRGDD